MHIGTSRSSFNCLNTPLTTIHLPYGLTLTSPASEKGPLLTSRGEMGYYKLHTQGPLHSTGKGTQQLISALTFVPRISLHKGAVFKCQVSYVGKDKIVEERFSMFLKLNPFGLWLSDVISMTVRATQFHPDVITFRWFCQGGELSPVASKASSSPRPNSEGFFSAFSQCKLPRSEVEKGATKVWVSVHHVALKQPITRETRGFIKRPCVSDIVSSTNASDQTLSLGCEITDFYPPTVSVTWLKLRDGEEDDREEELIPQERKNRGDGFTCRVQHCSLKEPIERHWRNGNNAAVTDPDTEGIEYIDEKVDEENKDTDRYDETISESDGEDSDKETEGGSGALHINKVNLRAGLKENEKACLRVCVEITHPALQIPVYRTWTGETNTFK
uniref:Ig-like domain-containing protein n=1 Tax=Fundulus heteroclitus TaxID=8078 RepID=A0A3Q2PJP3_FUNHE